jgi:hypothetical protein
VVLPFIDLVIHELELKHQEQIDPFVDSNGVLIKVAIIFDDQYR